MDFDYDGLDFDSDSSHSVFDNRGFSQPKGYKFYDKILGKQKLITNDPESYRYRWWRLKNFL